MDVFEVDGPSVSIVDQATDAEHRLAELAGVEGLDKRGDYRLVTKAKLASLGDPA